MKRKYFKSFQYLLTDFLITYVVWLGFVMLRRELLEGHAFLDKQQFINATVISLYWVALYALGGLYAKPYRRSRLREISQVSRYTFFGVLAIYFLILIDDPVPAENISLQRMLVLTYFLLQFGLVSFGRFFITTFTNVRIRRGHLGFPTLLVGSGAQALTIYEELRGHRKSLGYDFRGYVSLNGPGGSMLKGKLKHYGEIGKLLSIIQNRHIEEVIIALEGGDSDRVGEIIEVCERTSAQIKVVPGVYDYIVGSAKISHILGAPLIEIFPSIMKPWERVLKRFLDLSISAVALILLSPFLLVIAILIRLDSPGPVFFRQERIGRFGHPFFILKFRSMRTDAEDAGPSLATENDPRITRIGLWLRKTRMDELPQFFNVVIGEMSLVGPRPERQFYIDQIVKVAPHYRHLHKVRPGITSWGQVKYGYASSVEEMLDRLNYDILYMENMSMALDFKIILYTFIVIIEGRGK